MNRYHFIFILAIISLFGTGAVSGQEQIGMAWEFNEDGNSEGWLVESGYDAITIEDGILSGLTTVTNYPFPKISSGAIHISAADFGNIDVRMKAPGAEFALVSWYTDAGGFAFSTIDLVDDSDFHEYRLTKYMDHRWKDHIIKISISVHEAPVQTRAEFDYIRILHTGAIPEITRFGPERTIMKPGDSFPLFAYIKNSGDETCGMRSELILPGDIDLIQGELQLDHGNIASGMIDTLRWQIRCNKLGESDVFLRVYSDVDTIESISRLKVTDQFWEQDEFLLSAWSPPYAWYSPPYDEKIFADYQQANFNMALWARPDDELTGLLENHGQKYFILVTNLLGGDEYLREPSTPTAPEITPDMLANLDPVIEKYRDNPNVLGYHICDEPYAITFDNIGKVIRYIRERDPNRLCFVNIWPGEDDARYRNYIEDLLDRTKLEILSYDRYIFHNGYDEGQKFFSNIQVIREYAHRYNIPFYNIIQAIGTDGTIESHLNWRTPSEAEHRWQVYASLVYGVKGLIWFHWHGNWGVTGNPDGEQVYASIQKLNQEIQLMGKEMMKLSSLGIFHTNPYDSQVPAVSGERVINAVSSETELVVGIFQDSLNNDFAMLMNKDYTSSATAIIETNKHFSQIRTFDAGSDSWEDIAFSNGENGAIFEITLVPGGGKLMDLSQSFPVNVQDAESEQQKKQLQQNVPNPFSRFTQIRYTLNESGIVKLIIYNLTGQKISVLTDEFQSAPAQYSYYWDGRDDSGLEVKPGIYFARLSTGSGIETIKMINF